MSHVREGGDFDKKKEKLEDKIELLQQTVDAEADEVREHSVKFELMKLSLSLSDLLRDLTKAESKEELAPITAKYKEAEISVGKLTSHNTSANKSSEDSVEDESDQSDSDYEQEAQSYRRRYSEWLKTQDTLETDNPDVHEAHRSDEFDVEYQEKKAAHVIHIENSQQVKPIGSQEVKSVNPIDAEKHDNTEPKDFQYGTAKLKIRQGKYDVNKLLYDSEVPRVTDSYTREEEKGINPGYTLIQDKDGILVDDKLVLPVDFPMIFALTTNGLAVGVKNYFGLMDKPNEIFNIGPYEICPMSDLRGDILEMKAGKIYIKPVAYGFEYIKVGMKESKKIISSNVNSETVKNSEDLKPVESNIISAISYVQKIHLSTDKTEYFDPIDRYGHPSLTRKDYTLRLISELEMSRYISGENKLIKDEIYIVLNERGFKYLTGAMEEVVSIESSKINASTIQGKDARFELEQNKDEILNYTSKSGHTLNNYEVFYAGYVAAHPEKKSIELYLQSGRYHNDDLTKEETKLVESYIADVFLVQYNKSSKVKYESVYYYPWHNDEEGDREFARYLNGKDVYGETRNKEDRTVSVYNHDTIEESLRAFKVPDNNASIQDRNNSFETSKLRQVDTVEDVKDQSESDYEKEANNYNREFNEWRQAQDTLNSEDSNEHEYDESEDLETEYEKMRAEYDRLMEKSKQVRSTISEELDSSYHTESDTEENAELKEYLDKANELKEELNILNEIDKTRDLIQESMVYIDTIAKIFPEGKYLYSESTTKLNNKLNELDTTGVNVYAINDEVYKIREEVLAKSMQYKSVRELASNFFGECSKQINLAHERSFDLQDTNRVRHGANRVKLNESYKEVNNAIENYKMAFVTFDGSEVQNILLMELREKIVSAAGKGWEVIQQIQKENLQQDIEQSINNIDTLSKIYEEGKVNYHDRIKILNRLKEGLTHKQSDVGKIQNEVNSINDEINASTKQYESVREQVSVFFNKYDQLKSENNIEVESELSDAHRKVQDTFKKYYNYAIHYDHKEALQSLREEVSTAVNIGLSNIQAINEKSRNMPQEQHNDAIALVNSIRMSAAAFITITSKQERESRLQMIRTMNETGNTLSATTSTPEALTKLIGNLKTINTDIDKANMKVVDHMKRESEILMNSLSDNMYQKLIGGHIEDLNQLHGVLSEGIGTVKERVSKSEISHLQKIHADITLANNKYLKNEIIKLMEYSHDEVSKRVFTGYLDEINDSNKKLSEPIIHNIVRLNDDEVSRLEDIKTSVLLMVLEKGMTDMDNLMKEAKKLVEINNNAESKGILDGQILLLSNLKEEMKENLSSNNVNIEILNALHESISEINADVSFISGENLAIAITSLRDEVRLQAVNSFDNEEYKKYFDQCINEINEIEIYTNEVFDISKGKYSDIYSRIDLEERLNEIAFDIHIAVKEKLQVKIASLQIQVTELKGKARGSLTSDNLNKQFLELSNIQNELNSISGEYIDALKRIELDKRLNVVSTQILKISEVLNKVSRSSESMIMSGLKENRDIGTAHDMKIIVGNPTATNNIDRQINKNIDSNNTNVKKSSKIDARRNQRKAMRSDLLDTMKNIPVEQRTPELLSDLINIRDRILKNSRENTKVEFTELFNKQFKEISGNQSVEEFQNHQKPLETHPSKYSRNLINKSYTTRMTSEERIIHFMDGLIKSCEAISKSKNITNKETESINKIKEACNQKKKELNDLGRQQTPDEKKIFEIELIKIHSEFKDINKRLDSRAAKNDNQYSEQPDSKVSKHI